MCNINVSNVMGITMMTLLTLMQCIGEHNDDLAGVHWWTQLWHYSHWWSTLAEHSYAISQSDVHWGAQSWHCLHWLGNITMTLRTFIQHTEKHYDIAHMDAVLWHWWKWWCILRDTTMTLLMLMLKIGEYNYNIAHTDAVHWGTQLGHNSHWYCRMENIITALFTMYSGDCSYDIAHIDAVHGETQLSLIARFMGPTWAHLGPTGPRWAPCWPHELCYLGWHCPFWCWAWKGTYNYGIAYIDDVHLATQLWHCSHWCSTLGNTTVILLLTRMLYKGNKTMTLSTLKLNMKGHKQVCHCSYWWCTWGNTTLIDAVHWGTQICHCSHIDVVHRGTQQWHCSHWCCVLGTQLWHCSHWCCILGNTTMTLLTLML